MLLAIVGTDKIPTKKMVTKKGYLGEYLPQVSSLPLPTLHFAVYSTIWPMATAVSTAQKECGLVEIKMQVNRKDCIARFSPYSNRTVSYINEDSMELKQFDLTIVTTCP